ncbi:MAG: hypothetical protein FD167_81 [bacterium]|nr:MAG: hypothetical protein FD167_81 [bacterium]
MPYYDRNDNQTVTKVFDALNAITVDDLKKLVLLLPTSERATRKLDLISIIIKHLEEQNLKTLWSKLDKTQQAAVSEVVHSSTNYYESARFAAKYGEHPNWGESSSWSSSYITNPSPLNLFFYKKAIPLDLKERLKTFVPKPNKITLKVVDEIPEHFKLHWRDFDYETRSYKTGTQEIPIVNCETERAAQHDVQAVLRLIDVGKVTVSNKTLLPPSSTMKFIESVLESGDYYNQPSSSSNKQKDVQEDEDDYEEKVGYIKAFAWSMLMQATNLVELTGKRLSLTKAGKKALSLPPVEVIKDIWKRWTKTKIFDEFRRIDVIKGQTGKAKRHFTAMEGRRSVIAKALTDCEVGKWVSTKEFSRYMVAAGHDFEVVREAYELYICEHGYGNLGYEGYGGWNILQERYLLCLLFEYMATLGLIDVAYVPPSGIRTDYSKMWGTDDLSFLSRYDGLLYFRLNSLGAYCLGILDKYTPTPMESKPTLRVLPNREIAAIGAKLSPSDQLLLDLYTQKVSDSVWKLDQAKIMSAIETGRKISELEEFLEARSSHQIPETVKHFISDLAERANCLKNRGQAQLIECVDVALATLIANDSRTKKFCLLAGERHIVVLAEFESQFRKALRQIGYVIASNS